MICVSMGYPDVAEEIEILKRSQDGSRFRPDQIAPVLTPGQLRAMKKEVLQIYIHDQVYQYLAELARATRENQWTELGLSPRGSVALTAMSKAFAYLKGREYVTPSDVASVFPSVASHRLLLNMKARVGHVRMEDLIQEILDSVPAPSPKKLR